MATAELTELKLKDLKPDKFIAEESARLKEAVGDGLAINALSGGVDSSAVTLLGHRALGDKLKTYFIDHGLMREGEPQRIRDIFKGLGVKVELYPAKDEFFAALKGLTDPEEKREAITQTFYKAVFGRLVKEAGAKHLLQGTIYTDVEETVAGVKRQHNILSQLGIDTEEAFGYNVLEPLIRLRKPAVRVVAKELGLPEEISNRPPFPGPALVTRVIGEATPERIETVRKATKLVEAALCDSGAFQYMAILHSSKVTGMRDGKRDYGDQIEVRCWESKDATTGKPTRLDWDLLTGLADQITEEVPGIVSVTYNIASKPPSTLEVV